jgi:argininosuccinate lyase
MARQDLKGSLAHVTMLASTGILTAEEAEQIKTGIQKVEAKYEAGEIN